MRFDISQLKFESTAVVDPATEVFGQSTAEEALRFGMMCNAPGQNIYVRGTRGTGRLLLVRTLLRELDLRTEQKRDRCYVHNFKRPDRPRLITLAPGTAADFRRRVLELAEFIGEGMIKSLESEPFASQRNAIKESYQQMAQSLSDPLEEDLAKSEMTLTTVQQGDLTVPAILPVVEGKPIGPDQLRAMAKQGEIPQERVEQFETRYADFRRQMHAIGRQVNELYREAAAQVLRFNQQSAREMLADLTAKILTDFPGPGVLDFINEVVEDALKITSVVRRGRRFARSHGNLRREHRAPKRRSDKATGRPGNDAQLDEPIGHSRTAIRTRRRRVFGLSGHSRRSTAQCGSGISHPQRRRFDGRRGCMASTDANVADGLAGNCSSRIWLDAAICCGSTRTDPDQCSRHFDWRCRYVLLVGPSGADFRDLFKVLADFESQIERSISGVHQYAAVLSRLSSDENLPHFDREAVGGLVEHGAQSSAARKS